jgi:hypothetical protein
VAGRSRVGPTPRLVSARDAELARAQADLVQSRARETSAEAMIAHLRLAIAKMRRALYGRRSERGARLLEQMELELEDAVGRVRWIPDSKHDGKDNAAWYLFDQSWKSACNESPPIPVIGSQ